MTQPILSREEVLKIVRKKLKENNDRDKLSSDVFMKLYAEFEAAILEKVCGEPVAWFVEGSRTFVDRAYTSESTADSHIADRGEDGSRKVPLYAINRSKS
jgi:hypothetical protein